MRAPRDDSGSIMPLVPVVVLAMLMLGGLVVDGSRDLNARGRAQAYAEEAARAGAGGVDLTKEPLALDPTRAEGLVAAYCTKVSASNSEVVSCGMDTPAITDASVCGAPASAVIVHVLVRMRINTTLLGIAGVSALTASGRASARPLEGVTVLDAC